MANTDRLQVTLDRKTLEFLKILGAKRHPWKRRQGGSENRDRGRYQARYSRGIFDGQRCSEGAGEKVASGIAGNSASRDLDVDFPGGGADGGIRTRTDIPILGILSPLRLPFRHVRGSGQL
jgi:hypothetical protein